MKTLYKNVTVYSENDSYKADILVDGTDIADVGADLNCDADLIYDCTGLAALPALCDIHVHFRDPGQTGSLNWSTCLFVSTTMPSF